MKFTAVMHTIISATKGEFHKNAWELKCAALLLYCQTNSHVQSK